MARDPAFKKHRIAVYALYGAFAALLFTQLFRSVIGDLYGRRTASAGQVSPMACLDDVERLYDQLSARAVQPAPRGLESDALAREWDAWSRRWEDEVQSVSERCQLDEPKSPALVQLSNALDRIEELRRRLSRSGVDAADDARQVKEALSTARELLRMR